MSQAHCLTMVKRISIHSSRTGGDAARDPRRLSMGYFNPLLPHGRRHACAAHAREAFLFQSTPPAREETRVSSGRGTSCRFQSTPPAREETIFANAHDHHAHISIHSSRTGGDDSRPPRLRFISIFQSTPPAREETHGAYIHRLSREFQSTPPAREETHSTRSCSRTSSFQSTPPAREETARPAARVGCVDISIHSSRTGGDRWCTFPC